MKIVHPEDIALSLCLKGDSCLHVFISEAVMSGKMMAAARRSRLFLCHVVSLVLAQLQQCKRLLVFNKGFV